MNHWRPWHLMSPCKLSTMHSAVKMLADPDHSHFVLHTKVGPKNIGCIYMFISERGFIFVEIQMSPNLFISWVGKSWAITTQNYDSYNNIQKPIIHTLKESCQNFCSSRQQTWLKAGQSKTKPNKKMQKFACSFPCGLFQNYLGRWNSQDRRKCGKKQNKTKHCPTARFKSLFGQKRGRQAEKMFLSNNSIKKQIVLCSKSMAELAEKQRLMWLSSSTKVGM